MSNNKPIQQHEFDEWKSHPVTEKFFETLDKWRNEQKEVWASGSFISDTKYGTDILNAQAVSYCKTLDVIKDIQFEQLIESE